jgi:hypothetical protein
LKTALRSVPVALAMLFVIWFYHWTVKTGGGFNSPHDEDYYNTLVQGWRQGHLYMNTVPNPAMLTLSDPYDPNQNRDVRLGDASYYKGHYYLYFGAAPAFLLMLPYDLITGKELGTTHCIFIFCVLGYLAACAVWLTVRARYFPRSSSWVGCLGVLVLGLATHVLALERRPLVWELPISMAFAFSMLALLLVYRGLHCPRPTWCYGAAGLCLGLAVAARPTAIVGAIMFIPALWRLRRDGGAGNPWLRSSVAAACGLGVCVAGVLAHNFARFGSPLEFGQDYQLSGVYESRMHHFSPAYIPHNLFLYYFHPASWSLKFPFVAAAPVTGGPQGYLGNWSEAICGIAVTFPFVWMALALPLTWRAAAQDPRLRAILGSLAAFYLAVSVTILSYFVATERYMADFAPALGLLALIGWLELERRAARAGWTKLVLPLFVLASLSSAVAGIFVSFDYHGQLLHRISPQSWDRMNDWFSGHGL